MSLRSEVMQNPLLNTIINAKMLHNLKVLRLAQVQLIRVLTGLERIGTCGRIHSRHLLSHMVRSYGTLC